MWRGRTRPGSREEYVAFLRERVFPEIRRLPGNMGARVCRSVDDPDDVLVLSEWSSLAAVKAFAGDDTGMAVVEPEARALLESWDDRVWHFELLAEAE